jgi:hypothetical protein
MDGAESAVRCAKTSKAMAKPTVAPDLAHNRSAGRRVAMSGGILAASIGDG